MAAWNQLSKFQVGTSIKYPEIFNKPSLTCLIATCMGHLLRIESILNRNDINHSSSLLADLATSPQC